MKKWALALVGLSLVACGYFSPVKRACTKMSDLCGKSEPSEIEECTQSFVELDKATNGDASGKFASCVDSAQSCAEAIGCGVGAGVGAFQGVGGEILKGFQKGLGQ